MQTADWFSVVAAAISIAALILSARNRKQDIAREEMYRIRVRVWEILNGEAGYRSISALDDEDGKTSERLKFLKRTAEQLKMAGSMELGNLLGTFLGENQWPNADNETKASREGFRNAAAKFMQPNS